MPKSLADLLAETESFLDIKQTQEQLRSGRLQQEDVEEMAPPTPWRDFLTETLLDPSQYLTGAAMGAGFAAKLGRPALATALEWADPLMGGSKALGRAFTKPVGKWPVGARMGGAVGKGGGRAIEVSPEELIGTPKLGPAGLLESKPIELGPSSLPPPPPSGVKTLGEMFPLGMRPQPTGLLPKATFEMPSSSLAAGELSEDVVNLSNSFTRGLRQPIDELVEAADKMVSRNQLVREAEKILGQNVHAVRLKDGRIVTMKEAETHGDFLKKFDLEDIEETGWLKKGKFVQGSPTEINPLGIKTGDFVEFIDENGQRVQGKVRYWYSGENTAEVFTPKMRGTDRASEEIPLEKLTLIKKLDPNRASENVPVEKLLLQVEEKATYAPFREVVSRQKIGEGNLEIGDRYWWEHPDPKFAEYSREVIIAGKPVGGKVPAYSFTSKGIPTAGVPPKTAIPELIPIEELDEIDKTGQTLGKMLGGTKKFLGE